MTKVGEVIGPRTPSPSPMPWVRVVLPAPRSPVSTRRSPARSRAPRARPKACVRSGVSRRTSRSTSPPRLEPLLACEDPPQAPFLRHIGDDPANVGLRRDVDLLRSGPRRLVDELDEVGVEQVGVL